MKHDSTPTLGAMEQGATPLPVRPVPAEMPVDLYEAPTGRLFQLVGSDEDGLLFIPAELDRAQVARWLWAKESYLTDAFAGPLTRVERAA
ncbi:hypothetical protein ACFWTC_02965 [Streptomyces sp. NPDC058619]|uniref:hypothetical protein n=1 Tax=unclassified Streptomyces TaxID=2593676 RepID=UPI00365EB622